MNALWYLYVLYMLLNTEFPCGSPPNTLHTIFSGCDGIPSEQDQAVELWFNSLVFLKGENILLTGWRVFTGHCMWVCARKHLITSEKGNFMPAKLLIIHTHRTVSERVKCKAVLLETNFGLLDQNRTGSSVDSFQKGSLWKDVTCLAAAGLTLKLPRVILSSERMTWPDLGIIFKAGQEGSNKLRYCNEGLLKWTISLRNKTHPTSATTRPINIHFSCALLVHFPLLRQWLGSAAPDLPQIIRMINRHGPLLLEGWSLPLGQYHGRDQTPIHPCPAFQQLCHKKHTINTTRSPLMSGEDTFKLPLALFSTTLLRLWLSSVCGQSEDRYPTHTDLITLHSTQGYYWGAE